MSKYQKIWPHNFFPPWHQTLQIHFAMYFRNRKISIHLETAIQEAVDELEQQQKALAAKVCTIIEPHL